jgi:thiamine biosynthesis lipoprotein
MNRRQALRLLGSCGLISCIASCRRDPKLHQFSRSAFGTEVGFQVHGISEEKFNQLSTRCDERLRDIEALFSLHNPISLICQLNREGLIVNPPTDFLELIQTALHYSSETDGFFDITVQPLWIWRQNWKQATLPDRLKMESDGSWEQAISCVGYSQIRANLDQVSFNKKGMGITLNGIVQGYATEQIKQLLQAAGVRHALINIGEYAALGHSPNGEHWSVSIRSKGNALVARKLHPESSLSVSAGYGHCFDPEGRFHHLFRPENGSNPKPNSTIVVTAPNPIQADALATAIAVATPAGKELILRNFPEVTVEEIEAY